MLTTAKREASGYIVLAMLLVLGSCAPAPKPSSAALPPVSASEARNFRLWLDTFRQEAISKGIPRQVVDEAFAGVTVPSQLVVKRDQGQPEKIKTFEEYADVFLKERKLEAAREQWQSHEDVLAQVQEAYGVPAPVMLALWQTESNFGEIQGNFQIIESLATLAYDGRRSAFFREQLFDALVVLEQEHIPADALTGSWAGAMGQVQFMPSSFLTYAVDFDGDGKKDIWHDDADALASMANYLKSKGWDSTLSWGFRVRIPEGADATSWADAKEHHTLDVWKRRGLRLADGSRLPAASYEARLVMPDDNPDYAYLVTSNYDVLMDWNHSTYFATGIGLLADAIAAGGV